MAQKEPQYIAVNGLNYVPVGCSEEKRAEPGDDVDDLPPASLKWLLADGDVRKAVHASVKDGT